MQQYSNLIFIGLMVAVFWFLMIRPQQQRAKTQRLMLDALKPGDAIITVGGMHGTVVDVGERVRIAVADGSELEVARFAIAQVVSEPAVAGNETERLAGEDAYPDADA